MSILDYAKILVMASKIIWAICLLIHLPILFGLILMDNSVVSPTRSLIDFIFQIALQIYFTKLTFQKTNSKNNLLFASAPLLFAGATYTFFLLSVLIGDFIWVIGKAIQLLILRNILLKK